MTTDARPTVSIEMPWEHAAMIYDILGRAKKTPLGPVAFRPTEIDAARRIFAPFRTRGWSENYMDEGRDANR